MDLISGDYVTIGVKLNPPTKRMTQNIYNYYIRAVSMCQISFLALRCKGKNVTQNMT